MIRTRCMRCGERALADDYDSPALCRFCVDDDGLEERAASRMISQIGAQFVGHERGTRDDPGGP